MAVEAGGQPPGELLDAALPALRAELRLDGEAADGELARCLRAAAALCEAWTGTALIEREVVERIGQAHPRPSGAALGTVWETVLLPRSRAGGEWVALALTPVRSITGVRDLDGAVVPTADYRLDIGADGTGLVRAAGDVRVTYRAGLAAAWRDVPEPLALGVLRMAGHLWTVRDGAGAPPAAVTALWAPWARVRLGGPERRAA